MRLVRLLFPAKAAVRFNVDWAEAAAAKAARGRYLNCMVLLCDAMLCGAVLCYAGCTVRGERQIQKKEGGEAERRRSKRSRK